MKLVLILISISLLLFGSCRHEQTDGTEADTDGGTTAGVVAGVDGEQGQGADSGEDFDPDETSDYYVKMETVFDESFSGARDRVMAVKPLKGTVVINEEVLGEDIENNIVYFTQILWGQRYFQPGLINVDKNKEGFDRNYQVELKIDGANLEDDINEFNCSIEVVDQYLLEKGEDKNDDEFIFHEDVVTEDSGTTGTSAKSLGINSFVGPFRDGINVLVKCDESIDLKNVILSLNFDGGENEFETALATEDNVIYPIFEKNGVLSEFEHNSKTYKDEYIVFGIKLKEEGSFDAGFIQSKLIKGNAFGKSEDIGVWGGICRSVKEDDFSLCGAGGMYYLEEFEGKKRGGFIGAITPTSVEIEKCESQDAECLKPDKFVMGVIKPEESYDSFTGFIFEKSDIKDGCFLPTGVFLSYGDVADDAVQPLKVQGEMTGYYEVLVDIKELSANSWAESYCKNIMAKSPREVVKMLDAKKSNLFDRSADVTGEQVIKILEEFSQDAEF